MARSSGSTSSNSDNESHPSDGPRIPQEQKAASPELGPTRESTGEKQDSQRGRSTRPKLNSRTSSTIIIPRTSGEIEEVDEEYPPDDARAMSPRRDTAETEAMEEATRIAVRE
jgi:short coiled-coil protein